MTIIAVTATAEANASSLATLDGDRARAGEGSDGLRGRETVSMVAEHDQELGSQEVAGAWQRAEDGVVGMLGEEILHFSNLSRFLAHHFQ